MAHAVNAGRPDARGEGSQSWSWNRDSITMAHAVNGQSGRDVGDNEAGGRWVLWRQ